MREELISVIVPAFNAENYIERCLQSIQRQTYRHLEIIVVNDGSIDKTDDLVEEMQNKDSRIILINKKNEGVSSARNDGIKIARGKYLFFVDSDDYIDVETISKMYERKVNSKCELVVCGFESIFQNREKNAFSPYQHNVVLSINEYLLKMSEYLYSVYYGALWNKLYDADIITSNNILFEQQVSYAEDFLFNIKYLEYVNTIGVIPECLYKYYQDAENSLTKNRDEWILWKLAEDRLKKCINLYKKYNIYDKCKENLCTALSNELIGPTYYIVNNHEIGVKESVNNIKKIYSDEIIKESVYMTNKPTMVHRIAKAAYKTNSYTLFYILMKVWVEIQKIKK